MSKSSSGYPSFSKPNPFFIPLIPTLPSSAPAGQVYLQTSDNNLYFGDGTSWKKYLQGPIGTTDISNGAVTNAKLATASTGGAASSVVLTDVNGATTLQTLTINPPSSNTSDQLIIKDNTANSTLDIYSGSAACGMLINDGIHGFSFAQPTGVFTLNATNVSTGVLKATSNALSTGTVDDSQLTSGVTTSGGANNILKTSGTGGITVGDAIILANSSSSTTNNAFYSDNGILTMYSTEGAPIGKQKYFPCRRALVDGATGTVTDNYGISDSVHTANSGTYAFTITSSGLVPSVQVTIANSTAVRVFPTITVLGNTDFTVKLLDSTGAAIDMDFCVSVFG